MYRIDEKEIEAISRVIKSKFLFRYGEPKQGHRQEVVKFEKELAQKIGTRFSLCVASGTASLICGMVGLGIGPGDEVIVPGYTFMATALAPLAVGAIPVIAEIDESLTIDPYDLEKKISSRTKAVIPVHMCGLPCNMNAIMRIARKRKLAVLEDACQADGGIYKGRRLGSIGHAGAFSFNYYKIITSGEGGALVTSNRIVYERALIHHDGGCVFRPHAKDIGVPFFAGWNFRANEIMGAMLRVQLHRLDGMLQTMRSQKKLLVKKLSGHPALRFITHHDIEGDCGTTVGFLFDTEKEARAFALMLNKHNIAASLPIDSGRHVYSNWEPLMKKKGAHHPWRDAFRLSQNRPSRIRYKKDMCPHTLDILSRTVFIGMNPDWEKKRVEHIIKVCEKIR